DQVVNVAQQMAAGLGVDAALAQLQKATGPTQATAWQWLAAAQLEADAGQFAPAPGPPRAHEAPGQPAPPPPPARDPLFGLCALQTGAFEEARGIYQRVLERNPDDVRTLNNLAYVLTESLNRPQDALPLARHAAELAPGDAQVLDTLGWAQFKAGDAQAAVK